MPSAMYTNIFLRKHTLFWTIRWETYRIAVVFFPSACRARYPFPKTWETIRHFELSVQKQTELQQSSCCTRYQPSMVLMTYKYVDFKHVVTVRVFCWDNFLGNNGGANRGGTVMRIIRKIFHIIDDISFSCGLIWAKVVQNEDTGGIFRFWKGEVWENSAAWVRLRSRSGRMLLSFVLGSLDVWFSMNSWFQDWTNGS